MLIRRRTRRQSRAARRWLDSCIPHSPLATRAIRLPLKFRHYVGEWGSHVVGELIRRCPPVPRTHITMRLVMLFSLPQMVEDKVGIQCGVTSEAWAFERSPHNRAVTHRCFHTEGGGKAGSRLVQRTRQRYDRQRPLPWTLGYPPMPLGIAAMV